MPPPTRALGPLSFCCSLCNPTPSLTLGQASEQGPPIDATFPDLVETGNHPCATIPSAPTGQRCCCYSRPGYKALATHHQPSSTLVPSPCHPTFILLFCAATPRLLVFRHHFLVLLLSSTCSGPSCDRPLAQNNQSARHPAPSKLDPSSSLHPLRNLSRETLKPHENRNCTLSHAACQPPNQPEASQTSHSSWQSYLPLVSSSGDSWR